MPGELEALMDELPAGLQDQGGSDEQDDNEELDPAEDDSQDEENEDDAEDDGDDSETGDEDDAEEQDEEDDYDTDLDDDKPAVTTPPATPPAQTDEGQYILAGLSKISVNVVVPSADGKSEEIKTVEVYGAPQLPRNMIRFANKYEEKQFDQALAGQEQKARELQAKFRQERDQEALQAYTIKENKGIARDLKQLRTDGLFAKFRGVPGSKEFNESDGAKEFDRTMEFMNKENERARREANENNAAFYHVSFRQAFLMMKAVDAQKGTKRGEEQRRTVARKLKGGSGTKKTGHNVKTKPITNMTDLADEFADFAGNAAS